MPGGGERPAAADRLLRLCEEAARGSFPPVDWALEIVPAPSRVRGAVVAFTGFHIVAADVVEAEVRGALNPEDIAAPFNPAFLAWLGQRLDARVGHVDAVLARLGSGRGDSWLHPVVPPPGSERAERASRLRDDVAFLAPPEGGALLTVGRGLAGRWEISMEIDREEARNAGMGRRLVEAAVSRAPAGEAVFATVAPGNARSLRCLLAAGFAPIGAECLFSGPGADAGR